MNKEFTILPIWGRVKAASLPLSNLNAWLHLEFQHNIKDIINWKISEVNECFFPSIWWELRTKLKKWFLRPYIKTDQWLPWNFYPFVVKEDSEWENSFHYISDHLEAVIEPRYNSLIPKETINHIQNYYKEKNLGELYNILNTIDINRANIKGRSLFFVCRPARSNKEITIPSSLLPLIKEKVQELLYKGAENALEEIKKSNINNDISIESLLSSILYFQPDVHIDKQGNTTIEKINLPDVWFFLENLSDHGALGEIKHINRQLRKKVIEKILSLQVKKVFFLTNNNTIKHKEDLLEINEITILKKDLEESWVFLEEIDISSIHNAIAEDSPILLGNIDYKHLTKEEKETLFEYSLTHPEIFKPNPFLQIAMQKVTWFKQITSIWIEEKERKSLLDWLLTIANTNPTTENEFNNLNKKIEQFYSKIWFNPQTPIINISNDQWEFYPIHMQSTASMWKITQFIKENNWNIILSQVPYIPWNERLQKSWWDILHFYRFMWISWK